MNRPRQTALVTGASSGLGTALAGALAARGIDLVLTARRQDRLAALRVALVEQFGVEVTVLAADLAQPGAAEQLFRAAVAERGRLDILVNNAGFGVYGPFVEQSLEEIGQMIAVDLIAPTVLSRLFAEHCSHRGGYLLQVSSYAGLQPLARYAVYSAAKAYLIALSETLRYELRRHGVQATVVCPGFMPTEFHAVAGHRKTWLMRRLSLSPEDVARKAIEGLFRGQAVITPGAAYKINNLLLRLLPRRWQTAAAAQVVKSNSNRSPAAADNPKAPHVPHAF